MNAVSLNDEKRRYEIHVDGALAGFTEAHAEGDVVTFPHTKVFDEFGGQGLAGQLVGQALDDVRIRGQRVIASCSYVAGYIDKHPDYADLLA